VQPGAKLGAPEFVLMKGTLNPLAVPYVPGQTSADAPTQEHRLLCHTHGKLRSREFLVKDDAGNLVCSPEHRCRAPMRPPAEVNPAAGSAMPEAERKVEKWKRNELKNDMKEKLDILKGLSGVGNFLDMEDFFWRLQGRMRRRLLLSRVFHSWSGEEKRNAAKRRRRHLWAQVPEAAKEELRLEVCTEFHVLEVLGRSLKDAVEEVEEFRTVLARVCPKVEEFKTNFEALMQEKEELQSENASLKSSLEQSDAGSGKYNDLLARLQTDFKAVLKENEELRAENASLKSSLEERNVQIDASSARGVSRGVQAGTRALVHAQVEVELERNRKLLQERHARQRQLLLR